MTLGQASFKSRSLFAISESRHKEGCETVRIALQRFGRVKQSFIDEVLGIMDDCYNRINADAVEIVDLYLFDKSSAMNAFLTEEKRKLGIATSAFEASFFAVHDAWHGTPRIMVAYDRMLTLSELVRVGSLHHEIAHTILHGSLEYYSFTVPTFLLKLLDEGLFSKQIVVDLLYLVSIAVKDHEATRLLYENGFLEDQAAFCKHLLGPSEEDREAWKLSGRNETARLLALVSLLKAACCAAPLLDDTIYGKGISESIARSMSYLPEELSTRLSKILEAASKFGQNTHENVDLFMKKIVDELVIEGGQSDSSGISDPFSQFSGI